MAFYPMTLTIYILWVLFQFQRFYNSYWTLRPLLTLAINLCVWPLYKLVIMHIGIGLSNLIYLTNLANKLSLCYDPTGLLHLFISFLFYTALCNIPASGIFLRFQTKCNECNNVKFKHKPLPLSCLLIFFIGKIQGTSAKTLHEFQYC